MSMICTNINRNDYFFSCELKRSEIHVVNTMRWY